MTRKISAHNSPRSTAAVADRSRHSNALIRVLTASILLLGAVVVLSGCGNVMSEPRSIDITAEFNQTDRVLAGTDVMFGGTKIGEVTEVTTEGQKSIATLSLDSDKAGIVKQTATATITFGAPAQIALSNPAAAAESVQSGATIKGVNSPFEDTALQAGKAISTMQEALQQAASSFQNYLQSDEWKQSQQEVQRNLNDLGKHSADAANTMRQGVDELMRDLERQTSETMKEAQKNYGDIEKQLRQFSVEGQQGLLDAIQKLLESLQSAIETAGEQTEKTHI